MKLFTLLAALALGCSIASFCLPEVRADLAPGAVNTPAITQETPQPMLMLAPALYSVDYDLHLMLGNETILKVVPKDQTKPYSQLYLQENIKIVLTKEPVVTKKPDGTWEVSFK